MKPRRPCSVPGCAGLASPEGRGRCERHAAEAAAGRRARDWRRRREDPGRALYGLARWQAMRAAHLAANPLCAECGRMGLAAMADTVDHVIPHRGDRGRFFDAGNLQSLCKQCHDRKTAREDGGFGNRQGGQARGGRGGAAVAARGGGPDSSEPFRC